ncbi:MAG: 4Fe-4S binding protein [Candidatus Omnitrophota bacterium]
MKYPKIREIKEALNALVTRAYTTPFPYKPHIPFISFRGKPYFDQDQCVGCTACVNVCPSGALSFNDVKVDGSYKRILKIRWDICIECGQCQLNCLTERGIRLSNEFDISVTEGRKNLCQTIEKDLSLCEGCKEPVAPRDHIAFTIKKLGCLYVTNTSLIAFTQQNLGLREDLPKAEEEMFRWDRFRILCPSCRREAVIIS